MRQSGLLLYILSAWVITVVYDQLKVNVGMDIKLLLVVPIVLMAVGLYKFCRKPNEADEGEA